MKVLHITYSKDRGGASKACLRMHYALKNHNIDSGILTCLKFSPLENDIKCFSNSAIKQAIRKIKKVFNLAIVMWFQKTKNQDLHTFDIGTVINAKFINNSDADLVHFHWICYSMLGIKEIKKIKKPIVWTFHDMWPFMGCEHYDDINSPERYVEGYTKENKNIKGIDFNRLAWNMKRKHWKDISFNIICLSNWMKSCVEKSALLNDQKIKLIPNVIDENKFYPLDKNDARNSLNLPLSKKFILFGAFNTENVNKGGDLLDAALEKIKANEIELLIFGKDSGENIHGIKTRYLGYIKDETILNQIYNAADVMVVPSRQDNLPNTVLESIRTGTPVVGFNIGGLPDMVVHKKNGYLAQPFDVEELCKGIEFVLENSEIDFKENCINHFNEFFSQQVVVPKLIDYYKEAISK